MDGTIGLGVRWARAGVLALVALLTAAVAHVSGGGYLPGTTTLALMFLLTAAVSVLFLARPAGPTRVVLLVVGGQTLLHGAFAATAGHVGEVPRSIAAAPPVGDLSAARGSLADRFDTAVAAACGTCETTLALPAFLTHVVPDLTGPHAVMALLHLVAATVVGLYVAAGERALWSLVDHLRTVAVQAFAAVAALLAGNPVRVPAPAVRRSTYRPSTARDLMVVEQHSRRGPPLLALA